MSDLVFVSIGRGRIALDHRPKVRALDRLGCSHIVTLLSEREGARTIGEAASKVGIAWIWLPLENGQPPGSARDDEIRLVFDRIAGVLQEGGSLLIHCSAGIHRTGMIAHALLRHLGCSGEDARAKLLALRGVTADGVGEARLAWGDRFSPPPRQNFELASPESPSD